MFPFPSFPRSALSALFFPSLFRNSNLNFLIRFVNFFRGFKDNVWLCLRDWDGFFHFNRSNIRSHFDIYIFHRPWGEMETCQIIQLVKKARFSTCLFLDAPSKASLAEKFLSLLILSLDQEIHAHIFPPNQTCSCRFPLPQAYAFSDFWGLPSAPHHRTEDPISFVG